MEVRLQVMSGVIPVIEHKKIQHLTMKIARVVKFVIVITAVMLKVIGTNYPP